MPLMFETPEERLAQRQKANILLLGGAGVGKTYAARTLDPATTLFIDGEAGSLALGKWQGTTLNIRKQSQLLGIHPWEMCRAIACILSGPDPKAGNTGAYSKASHALYVSALGSNIFDSFQNIFVDSVTVASRWSFDWACKQPESFNKQGVLDTRGAYGLHGREMIEWVTQLQHQPRNIIMTCILDEKLDDFKRKYYEPQIVGGMSGRELPGIFDVMVTLAKFPTGNEASDDLIPRWLATRHGNRYGLPAKDRSGVLADFEPPDLGALIKKIQTANII